MFDVSINVLCDSEAGTSAHEMTPIDGCGKHTLNVGLIMHFHFVGLDNLLENETTHATSDPLMSCENPEQIVNIAPAEGQKPLFFMTDKDFELMCNPDKFCFGKGGFGKIREREITYRKYFNARKQDIDGRLASDLDYLFVGQYIVETKQVLDDGNNFAWRQKPSQQLAASQVKDRAFLSENVRNYKAYRFLKNVHGLPPYYQCTFMNC